MNTIADELKKPDIREIQLVIWDCDGVLVDSEHLAAKAFYQIIQEWGGQLTLNEVYQSLKGGSIYKAIDYVKENSNVPDHFEIEQAYRARSFELFRNELQTIPGVENILKSLNRSMCVASNGPRIKINHNLEITGLQTYFKESSIFSGHDIQKFKPDPELFIHAAKNSGYDLTECLIIEDSEHGALAAKRAGMKCMGYTAETNSELFHKHDAIPFQHMSELFDLMNEQGLMKGRKED
ncbi:MAG: HAD-IA family hydrolase [Saprospiraceae bacterium]|nr:HAD-IA family hydrolase [Saprospiraceae bacterium]